LSVIVPKRIPAKIKTDNKKTENCIPNAGMAKPDKSMNPKAEPARSALYTEDEITFSVLVVISRKRWPVNNAGRKVETNIITNEGKTVFMVIRLL
jgi:hypothetical protein